MRPRYARWGVLSSVTRRAMFENSNVSVDGEGVEHYPLFARPSSTSWGRTWSLP